MCLVDFPARWSHLARRLGLSGDIESARDAMLAAYDEPHRHYHTRQHLAECLSLLDQHAGSATDPDAVAAALWFHDAVYVPGAADNESRSAELLRRLLDPLGLPQPRAAAIARLIQATDHRRPGTTDDERLICDIDLAILGASRGRYDAYAAGIRAEAPLPQAEYVPRRRAFLESLLARPAIYQTTVFQRTFESTARANLRRELAALAAS